MYDYQQNAGEFTAQRERAVYEKLVGVYNQLLFAADEGVFEVTIRSQSGAIVVPVSLNDGSQLTHDLLGVFCKQIDRVEDSLNRVIAENGVEVRQELARKQQQARQREEDAVAARAAYEAQTRVLAVQATVEPAGPKRVRQSRPDVMKQTALAASGVPMNQTAKLPTA